MCLLEAPPNCCRQLHSKQDKTRQTSLFYNCMSFLFFFFCCLRASDSMDRQNNMPKSTLKHVLNLSPGPCSKVELPDVSFISPEAKVTKHFSLQLTTEPNKLDIGNNIFCKFCKYLIQAKTPSYLELRLELSQSLLCFKQTHNFNQIN